MEAQYNYTDLIEILRWMFVEDKIKEQDTILWDKLQLSATESIIDRLLGLANDVQRTAFLNAIFGRMFDDGKGYNLALYEVEGVNGFENDLDFKFIQNCKWVLNGLITDVSEACLQYEGIDFSNLMANLPKHFPDSINEYNFTWYKNGTLNVQVADGRLNKENPYSNFDELFIDHSDIDKCINALRKVHPPIIDDTGRFIGKNKGAFVIWIDVLRKKGKLRTINDKFLPELLEEKFPGLKISASLFRQPPGRAEAMYKLDFQALI
jgi:hypothetical protein